MKVIYLTYDGLSDPLGQSQVLPYLFGLSQKGHDITIVSFEKKENFAKQYSTLKAQLDEKKIKWVILKYTKRPPVLSTLFDILKLRATCFSLQRKNNFKAVHCRSYITSFVGLALKNKFGMKFIFDMRGFYADERVDGGLWNQNKLLYRLIYRYFKRKEKAFILSADKVVSLTQAAKKILSNNFPSAASKIHVIPCCADTDHFNADKVDPSELRNLRASVSLKDDAFVLSYLGGIGTWYMLDEMFDFYNRLSQTYPDSKFLFITHTDKEEILTAARKRDVNPEKILVLRAGRSEVPLFLSLSTISIFFIMPSYSKMASSPTKQAEVLSMGIPIICNSNIGDTEAVIHESQAGILVEKFTNEEYDKAIQQIPSLLQKSKSQIRASGVDMFSLVSGVNAYQEIYSELERR